MEQADTKSVPLVSIIIPTHNREELLAHALESCFCQTYDNVEVIVIDDGSSDETVAFLERKNKEYGPRLKWATQLNRGPAAARNTGLRMAQGEFIKFLDSDDSIDCDAIQYYVEALSLYDAHLCIGSRRYMSPTGKKWSVNYSPAEGMISNPLKKYFNLDVRPQQGLWCFRSTIFQEGLQWNETLRAREDTDLLGRILLREFRVCGAPLATYNQRCHNGPTVSSTQFHEDLADAIFQSNVDLYDEMVESNTLKKHGRHFARALCRTSVRLWEVDRAEARRYSALARRCFRWPELVLLKSYSRLTRITAYAMYAIGGLPLSGRLFAMRNWAKRLGQSNTTN